MSLSQKAQKPFFIDYQLNLITQLLICIFIDNFIYGFYILTFKSLLNVSQSSSSQALPYECIEIVLFSEIAKVQIRSFQSLLTFETIEGRCKSRLYLL